MLLNSRAQDKAAMQLSELEEEMDQRIQAAEHKTRKDVSLWDQPPQGLSTRAFLVVVVWGQVRGERIHTQVIK